MNCEPYIELMSAALDGECTAEERQALDSHLAVCPECAALYEQLRRNAQAARELDCEVPAHLKARIMANLPPQEPAKQGKVIRWKRWVPVAAAACVVLVVSLLPKVSSTNDSAMMNVNTGTAESAFTAKSEPQAGYSADSPESYTVVADNVKAGGTADGSAPTGSEPSGTDAPAVSTEPSANTGSAENSGGTINYGNTAEPNDTNPEINGTSGTNANGSQTGTEDVNIQTGENLAPGLTPGQNTGGITGGSENFTGVPAHYGFQNQQAIRVSYGATPEAPSALVIGSVDALNDYLARFGSRAWDENGNPLPIAGLEALRETYTEEFFLTNRLLCVVVESGSGSNRYELAPQGLFRDVVTVKVTVPEIGTCDMAAWLLVAEVDAMFDGGDRLEVVIIN